jgi:hypothetical protein
MFVISTAAISHVEKGDNAEEKPMWAARGGLDFDGRELWDQYTALKVACKAFCDDAYDITHMSAVKLFLFKTRHMQV